MIEGLSGEPVGSIDETDRRRGSRRTSGLRRRRAGGGRLPQLSARPRTSTSASHEAIVGSREGRGARLRQHEVLRGVPADRGDGAPGRRHAALRADEAGRADATRERGRWPYAVVQLRQDNLAGDHYSLVGFQTQLKWGEQARVLRLIPGLERAEFVRFGMIHRNTYINAPTMLEPTWQTRTRPDLFFAGQVSGVEGYVESAASGLMAGRNAARLVRGEAPTCAAADDGDRRARALRVARRPAALRTVEHHVRHHPAARRRRRAPEARASARDERSGAGGSGSVGAGRPERLGWFRFGA